MFISLHLAGYCWPDPSPCRYSLFGYLAYNYCLTINKQGFVKPIWVKILYSVQDDYSITMYTNPPYIIFSFILNVYFSLILNYLCLKKTEDYLPNVRHLIFSMSLHSDVHTLIHRGTLHCSLYTQFWNILLFPQFSYFLTCSLLFSPLLFLYLPLLFPILACYFLFNLFRDLLYIVSWSKFDRLSASISWMLGLQLWTTTSKLRNTFFFMIKFKNFIQIRFLFYWLFSRLSKLKFS